MSWGLTAITIVPADFTAAAVVGDLDAVALAQDVGSPALMSRDDQLGGRTSGTHHAREQSLAHLACAENGDPVTHGLLLCPCVTDGQGWHEAPRLRLAGRSAMRRTR